MKNIRHSLEQFLAPDQILDSALYREVYARDASYFRIPPQAIVRPRTVSQIQQLLALSRQMGIGVTFRTGGTSLSGQTLGAGIICELRTDWKRYEIRDEGKKVWFEPGITAWQLNAYLNPHHHHIGPDPASAQAAMMGGILSNNSSGMSAGVKYNSYHTLSSIEFLLANGRRYNTASATDRKRFADSEKELCRGLLDIRARILANPELKDKIERKYQIKNVTGYSMNSFVDFSDPMDIFAHLLIGAEGTLGYIVSAELETLPLDNVYSSTLLYFDNVTLAADQAKWLGDSGARCVEMMDYASLRSYMGKNLDMPRGTTAMLIDYGADSPEEMADIIGRLTPQLAKLTGVSRIDDFTHTVDERAALWSMRNGIFPCVAGVRVPGATVILEDVAAPVADLGRLVDGVQDIFAKYDYQGAIFGHARDGNIHPLLTTPIGSGKELDRFRNFMDDIVDCVVRLDGSLKAEHGTGRAIAPFVAREWGDDIYAMMCEVKKLADPGNILNPGVVINHDPDCFLKPMKHLPVFGKQMGYERADMCMECGYCEHVCPTREITLTPRQRLQALRVIEDAQGDERRQLEKEYVFQGEESCCSDGSCQIPCPMGISTAIVTDCVRDRTAPGWLKKSLTWSASRYGGVQTAIRDLLKAAVISEKVISPWPLIWASGFAHRISHYVPHWSKYFPMPAKLHYNEEQEPEYIYFPSCVTRIFGGSNLGKDDLAEVILRIGRRAGFKISLPKEMHSLCCSQIWNHKGDPEGKKVMANKTVDTFYRLSDGGRIPIFCDTSSCTHTLLLETAHALTEENKKKFEALRILDITEWLDEHVMPRLQVTRPKGCVLLHPTCAVRILRKEQAMVRVASRCAREVVVPVNTHCCGAAGDRGFLFPEIARSAISDERAEIDGRTFDGYYSLARTCEISMQQTIERPYESIVYLVDEATS